MSSEENSRPGRLLPASVLTLIVSALFVWQAARITGGFEYWTLEEARQAQVAAGTLHVSPMELRDTVGRRNEVFSSTEAQGKTNPVFIVDFIYTRCDSVCSVLGSEFQQIQRDLAQSPNDVQLLSISIAPGVDDTESLAQYARRFSASASTWRITAPLSQADLTKRASELGIVVIPDGQGGYVHNGDIHLINSAGRVLGIWAYEEWEQALAAARKATQTQ